MGNAHESGQQADNAPFQREVVPCGISIRKDQLRTVRSEGKIMAMEEMALKRQSHPVSASIEHVQTMVRYLVDPLQKASIRAVD